MPITEITGEMLRQIMPNLPAAKRSLYLPFISAAMIEFGITTELRAAAFLAQLAHESAELRYMEEIASGKAYEGRKDLGNIHAGDGQKFKGRGPIQLTGRANYRKYGKLLGLDLEDNPEQAETPQVGFRIAGQFWDINGLNELADKRQFKAITKRINGGYNGLADRVKYYDRALRVLPDDLNLDGADKPVDEEHPDLDTEDIQQTQAVSEPAPPKPENPIVQDVTVPAVKPDDKSSGKSLKATLLAAPALLVTWALTNIEKVFGWLTGIKVSAIDPHTQRIVLISVAIILGLFILRQIIGKMISEIGALILTMKSMQYHADPTTNNVTVSSPAPKTEG
jgi:predicted chitinase